MKIIVSQDYIEKGVPRAPYACPIALAAQAQLPCYHVFVDGDTLGAIGNRHTVDMSLPKQAKKFVEDFDSGKPVEPITIKTPFWFDLMLAWANR